MIPSHRIVVCGSTVYLEAIANSLSMQPDLEVTLVNPHHPDALARVAALTPNVVIVGHADQSDWLTSKILQQGFPMIGLDIHQNTVTILSRRQSPVENVGDLVQVIGKVIAIWEEEIV